MRKLLIGLLMLLVAGIASAQDTPESVCLITDIGRVNDGTFNEFAYDGMIRAVEEFNLDSSFIETQFPTDYANNIAICLDEGFDIIITVGFALADATYEAAEDNPDVYFIGVDQDHTEREPLPNIAGLQFREDQAGFLAGAMAAMMTETGIVAGVYGDDIPPVVKFRNGFEQGARYIDPEIQTLGVYIPDFQAPAEGADAAERFIAEGADVIFGAGGPTGTGGIIFAAAEGVLVIGVDQDQYYTDFGEGDSPGAENLITSAIKRVDNGVYDLISFALTGEGFPEDSNYVVDAAGDGIDFAPPNESDVPEDVTERMNKILDELRSGEIETGVDPLTGQLLGEDSAESEPASESK